MTEPRADRSDDEPEEMLEVLRLIVCDDLSGVVFAEAAALGMVISCVDCERDCDCDSSSSSSDGSTKTFFTCRGCGDGIVSGCTSAMGPGATALSSCDWLCCPTTGWLLLNSFLATALRERCLV